MSLGQFLKLFYSYISLRNNLVNPDTIIENIPKDQLNVQDIQFLISKKFPENLSVEDILIRSSNIGTLLLARKIGEEKYRQFIKSSNLLESPDIQLEEVGNPIDFDWNKCKLKTISFGHGITATPIQATSIYAALVNGGKLIKPSLIKQTSNIKFKKADKRRDQRRYKKYLKKVVTEKDGTASLADIHGYEVGGKTGTHPSNTKIKIKT